ncbi:hypothetical protein KIPB_007486, partial [Kipferlia bialata]|eukprot:g7486.t1
MPDPGLRTFHIVGDNGEDFEGQVFVYSSYIYIYVCVCVCVNVYGPAAWNRSVVTTIPEHCVQGWDCEIQIALLDENGGTVKNIWSDVLEIKYPSEDCSGDLTEDMEALDAYSPGVFTYTGQLNCLSTDAVFVYVPATYTPDWDMFEEFDMNLLIDPTTAEASLYEGSSLTANGEGPVKFTVAG